MLGRDVTECIQRRERGSGRAVKGQHDAVDLVFCRCVDELFDDQRGAVIDVIGLGEVENHHLVAHDVIADGADELA